MGLRVHAFLGALARWVVLVGLALIPTVIVVVTYRKLRGQPLWSLSDIPVAAEVTLCLAWLSLLLATNERLQALANGSLPSEFATAALASAVAATAVVCGYQSIALLRHFLGLDADPSVTVPTPV